MSFKKKLSDFLPILKDQGIDHVVAANKAGQGLQCVRAVQSGSAPWAVTFAGLGLADMADATYDVIVQGPNGDERCDYATRGVKGFSITGGANTEAMTILVVGRIAGQS
jgi:hypothetical protein